jgi:hypothetical protein
MAWSQVLAGPAPASYVRCLPGREAPLPIWNFRRILEDPGVWITARSANSTA